jgi:hypothetical protein
MTLKVHTGEKPRKETLEERETLAEELFKTLAVTQIDW